MSHSLTRKLDVTVGQPSDPCDMVRAVDVRTDLVPSAVDLGLMHEGFTFATVKSQLGSIRRVKVMRASGTCQSFTGGGFG